MENNYEFKIGDEIIVVEPYNPTLYSKGAIGEILEVDNQESILVEFNQGEYSGRGKWWLMDSEIELLESYTPPKIRGFEIVSPPQWVDSLPQDVDQQQWEELYTDLKLPKRGTKHSSGYDFFSPFEFTLEPNEDIKIPTGIKSYMLEDEYLAIHTRSSLGFKYYSRLANITGIVDSDYYNNENNEGLIYIKIRNEGSKSMTIKKGEAVAQGIFQKFLLTDNDSFDEGNTRRGGIGSTN